MASKIKKKNPNKIPFSSEQKEVVRRVAQTLANQAIDVASDELMLLVLWRLHNDFGWGKTRLERILKNINSDFDALKANRVKFDDIAKTLKTETKMDIDYISAEDAKIRNLLRQGVIVNGRFKEDILC